MATDTRAKTVISAAVDSGRVGTFLSAVKGAGLVDTLTSSGPFTVFAPVDEAFAALPDGTLGSLLADKVVLAGLINHHVLRGQLLAVDILGHEYLRPVENGSLRVQVDSGGLRIGSATMIQSDIETENGIIHLIDSVLLPEQGFVTEGIGEARP